ncbi:MAG: hypothetical protein JWP97_2707 [Labilithrix sp.]|nr:hypothetical protein [Labilithrix sp.]
MMNGICDDEDLALPLLRRTGRPYAPAAFIEAEEDMPLRRDARRDLLADRFAPASAGALAGAAAGAASLGLVHALHVTRITDGILRAAGMVGVPGDAAVPLAYLAAAVLGAAVGAAFASVTRHLRRLVPLMFWAEVFFVSLAMLALAASATYGRGVGVAMAPAILAGSAVFAFVASFQLKLRVRARP